MFWIFFILKIILFDFNISNFPTTKRRNMEKIVREIIQPMFVDPQIRVPGVCS